MERLDKILSHEGFGSRKDIKKLLRHAEVLINGKQTFDPSTQINMEKDIITIDGEQIDLHQNIYLMMNKIMHTVSSTKEGDHQTVFDLLEDNMRTPYLQDKLHLVGRLDMDTEGLLIFTTDGELTHRVTSPKTHISKTYFCGLEHDETDESRAKIEESFKNGIEVGPDDNDPAFKCEPAFVKWPDQTTVDSYVKNSSCKHQLTSQNCALLTIYEGKYHQVKRMFQAAGNKIIFLKRISMGSLQLDDSLAPGQYRFLSEEEIQLLK